MKLEHKNDMKEHGNIEIIKIKRSFETLFRSFLTYPVLDGLL